MTDSVREFLLPDLGEGLEDATIIEWHVDVGDRVELNQPLCTVETHKAQVEIPSPHAGRVVALGGAEGETVDVGAMVVRIAVVDGAAPDSGRRPVLVGYGADDGIDTSRRRRASGRPRAAPRTRKLAAELGVDLTELNGSGAAEVISPAQVLAAATVGDKAGEEFVDVTGVQAAMARQMTLSRHEIPDAHAQIHADCSSLLRVRDTLRDKANSDAAVTPFVLVLKLMVVALQRHRRLNATWVDGSGGARIRLHSAVHLGFGVATPRGLLVPVVRDAAQLSTRRLAEAVTRLSAEARAGTVAPADLRGSTCTVSNFGALGLDDGVPVINHPEAAIVGIGSIKARPVVVDGAVVARPTAALTCAFDHRVVDGAQAAGFLCELRDLIESPELALLDL